MSSSGPLLTVVIPFRNRTESLTTTLNSISALAYPGCDVDFIFVNNASDTAIVVKVTEWIDRSAPEWIKATLINEMSVGASVARNTGLRNCLTPWIMFFDSDDKMPPNHLINVIDGIKKNPQAHILYWNVRLKTPGGKILKKSPHKLSLEKNVLLHGIWSTARYAVRTEFIRNIGGWNENLDQWDDWELAVRLLLGKPKTHRLKVTDSIIANLQADSISGLNFSGKVGKWEKAMDTASQFAGSNGEETILKLIDLKRAVLAAQYHREGCHDAAKSIIGNLKRRKAYTFPVQLAFFTHKLAGKGSSVFSLLITH